MISTAAIILLNVGIIFLTPAAIFYLVRNK